MKKIISVLLLLAMLTLTAGVVPAVAETDWQAELAALPATETLTDPDAEEFGVAAEQYYDMIYRLAQLDEEEMLAIEGVTKVFDGFWDLTACALKAAYPDYTSGTVEEQAERIVASMYDIGANAELQAFMPVAEAIVDYTSPVPDPNDPDSMITYGALTYQKLQEEAPTPSQELIDYMNNMSEEDSLAIAVDVLRKSMGALIDSLPETATEENFYQFGGVYSVLFMVQDPEPMPDDETGEPAEDPEKEPEVDAPNPFREALTEEQIEKLRGTVDMYRTFVHDNKAELSKNMDEYLASVIDWERLETASPLALALILQPAAEEAFGRLNTLLWYDDEDSAVSEAISHLEEFNDYYSALQGEADYIVYGDLDGDEEINAKDALLVLKAAVGKIELTEDQSTAADVTADGEVDARDALDILKYAVGKLDSFKVFDLDFDFE